MTAAASLAVAATGTMSQLCFVHEESGQSFVLDVTDLFRHDVRLDAAKRRLSAFRSSGWYDGARRSCSANAW